MANSEFEVLFSGSSDDLAEEVANLKIQVMRLSERLDAVYSELSTRLDENKSHFPLELQKSVLNSNLTFNIQGSAYITEIKGKMCIYLPNGSAQILDPIDDMSICFSGDMSLVSEINQATLTFAAVRKISDTKEPVLPTGYDQVNLSGAIKITDLTVSAENLRIIYVKEGKRTTLKHQNFVGYFGLTNKVGKKKVTLCMVLV